MLDDSWLKTLDLLTFDKQLLFDNSQLTNLDDKAKTSRTQPCLNQSQSPRYLLKLRISSSTGLSENSTLAVEDDEADCSDDG